MIAFTKIQAVLNHLKKFKSITPAEAYDKYHTMRLSAIIFVLRDTYKIETQMQEKETVYGTVRFAKYVYKGIKK